MDENDIRSLFFDTMVATMVTLLAEKFFTQDDMELLTDSVVETVKYGIGKYEVDSLEKEALFATAEKLGNDFIVGVDNQRNPQTNILNQLRELRENEEKN